MSHMWEEALCCVCTACVLFENHGETRMSRGEGCPCCVRCEGNVQQHRGAEQACGPSPAPGQAPSLRKRPWQATRSILARGLGQRATFPEARALLPGPAPLHVRLPRPRSVHTPSPPQSAALSRTRLLPFCAAGTPTAHSEGKRAALRQPMEPVPPRRAPLQADAPETCPWNLCTTS